MLTIYNKKKEKKFGSSSPFEIFVDQAGYLTESTKKAVLPFFAEVFAVVDENGERLFDGPVTHFGTDPCSDDDVYIADFSAFKRPGSYRISSNGKTSALFRIGDEVYNKLFFDVTKAFYFTRCGCALEEKYAGAFTHARCHSELAEILAEGSLINVTGGWHDAGDYGRYVTSASCACAHLLYAYKFFPEVFAKQDLGIPESGSGIPDILSECRYELDWLLKMQREDGSVCHKATTMRHASFLMPEKDVSQMYVFTISSYATADFCAVCALAAGVFADIDPQYAGRLKRAALRAYAWLEEHPEIVGFYNPAGCDTGVYAEESDIDNRYWAAAELYSLTGDTKFNNHFRTLYRSPYFEGRSYIKTSLGYGFIGGLGSLSYVLCNKPEKDTEIITELRDLFIGEAYYLRDKMNKSGYGACLEDWEYYWGSNMVLLHHGVKFVLARMLTGEKEFYTCALEQLHVLLGRNALGVCYVTGTGEYSSFHPHHRQSIADGIEESIPGFVIGGPNRELSDPTAKELIPSDTPPMKCFYDDERCYSLNEVAIYWNSPAVFLLAAVESGRFNGDLV